MIVCDSAPKSRPWLSLTLCILLRRRSAIWDHQQAGLEAFLENALSHVVLFSGMNVLFLLFNRRAHRSVYYSWSWRPTRLESLFLDACTFVDSDTQMLQNLYFSGADFYDLHAFMCTITICEFKGSALPRALVCLTDALVFPWPRKFPWVRLRDPSRKCTRTFQNSPPDHVSG